MSKGVGYYPGSIDVKHPKSDHAWNIVKLNGEPYFLEAIWLTGAASMYIKYILQIGQN